MFESLQIRENSVVIYESRLFSSCHANRHLKIASVAEARKTQYCGKMTTGGRKRMAKAITLMCQGTKAKWMYMPETGKYHYHRLSFITLTITDNTKVDGKWANEFLLKPFVRWLREVKCVSHHIWKKEFQKRGQIHYHITSPAFIHHQEIRDKWNEIQKEHGLIDDYAKEYGHFRPPSTEIREVKNVKNMSSYLVKELGKSINATYLEAKKKVNAMVSAGELPDDDKVIKDKINELTGEEMKTEGRVWGCSEQFAGTPYFSVDLRAETLDTLREYRDKKQLFWLDGDYFSIIFFNQDLPPPWHLLDEREKKNFDDHIGAVFAKERPQKKEIIIDDVSSWTPPKNVNGTYIYSILAENIPAADPELNYTPSQFELCFN
jgi:hypothetical protein